MINISKKIGVAGGWINPSDNKIIILPPSKEEFIEQTPIVDKPVIEESLEQITQPIEVVKKENIFIKIIKSIINFMLNLFKK